MGRLAKRYWTVFKVANSLNRRTGSKMVGKDGRVEMNDRVREVASAIIDGVRHALDEKNVTMEEYERLDIRKALVLCTLNQTKAAMKISGLLADRSDGIYPHAVMHTPVEVTERALMSNNTKSMVWLPSVAGQPPGLGRPLHTERTFHRLCYRRRMPGLK